MGLFDFFKRKSSTRVEEKSSPVNVVSGHSIAERVDLTSETIERVGHRFIAFDVETTGLSPETDRIVEFGAVLFVDGVVVDRFSSLVNPGVLISASASAVNHITNDMISGAPKEIVIYKDFAEFLGNAYSGETIMCAHNARFDFDFLCNTFSRLGYNAKIKYLDTLSLSRKLIKGLDNYKQATIEQYFGLSNRASHRAESDAELCGEILCRLLATAEGVIKEEKAQLEKSTPSDAEFEVCAVIQRILADSGKDISLLGFRKNSSGYVDVSFLYTILKFKFAKKGRYIILDNAVPKRISLPQEPCSASEGGTANIRIYFSNPLDLVPLKESIIAAYEKAYISLQDYRKYYGTYADKEARKWLASTATLSDDDVARLIKATQEKDYGPVCSIKIDPIITRDMVKVNAVHNRCPLEQIKNFGDCEKGFDAGFKYYERAEEARKKDRLEEAIALYDKARFNGYDAPALYDGYAMTYHKLKDYDNEIVIIEEFLSRGAYGKDGRFEARRTTAIKALYSKQEAERKEIEKAIEKEKKKKEKEEKAQVKEKVQRGRAICQLDDAGNVIAVYDSLSQAVETIGVSSKSIRDAANGVQKHAGGFCWKYKDQLEGQ